MTYLTEFYNMHPMFATISMTIMLVAYAALALIKLSSIAKAKGGFKNLKKRDGFISFLAPTITIAMILITIIAVLELNLHWVSISTDLMALSIVLRIIASGMFLTFLSISLKYAIRFEMRKTKPTSFEIRKAKVIKDYEPFG